MNQKTWILLAIAGAVLILFKTLSRAPADNIAELNRKGALLIDVRTEHEYKARGVAGAVNIPLDAIRDRIRETAPNPDLPILLFCASGARSEVATRILRGMGYRNVLNVGSYRRANALLGESDKNS